MDQEINNEIKENSIDKEKLIEFSHVCKYYEYEGGVIKALDDVNFTINKGELVIILGDSGAGKSTALNILGGMDFVTSGEVTVDNVKITDLPEEKLVDYRRDDIGFVFVENSGRNDVQNMFDTVEFQ